MSPSERRAQDWLTACLRLGPGEEPFPWQLRSLDLVASGELVPAVDIPTGLGKTLVDQATEIPTFKIRGQGRIKHTGFDKWIDAQPQGGDEGHHGE